MAAYQIVILEAAPTPFTAALGAAIRSLIGKALGELGLDAGELVFLGGADIATLDQSLPAVAAYLSDTAQPVASPALREVLARALFVLPIVSTLTRFTSLVPAELRPINGLESPSPSHLASGHAGAAAAAVERLFEELRLLRRNRGAFISYKRVESSGVAEQLHEALERRRYEVFLDTFSVDYGVDFQSVLWDRMACTDVVVLLTTPTAFDSKWVEQEITQANVAGLAVLQLIWPGLARPPGTEFSEVIYLERDDFEPALPALGSSGAVTAKLKSEKVADAVAGTEMLRARAQATRRRRVLGELKDAAERNGVNVCLQKDGVAELMAQGAKAPGARHELLLPIVGPPDARILHDHWLEHQKAKRSGVLLYDAIGVLATRSLHLGWLNTHLPQKAVAIQELDRWLKQNLV